MEQGPQLLLIGAVAAVGLLHTMVPDHWVPITLLARQQGWSTRETARAALIAGAGHVASTLAIAVVVWLAGAALAQRLGSLVDELASAALILFGGFIAISSLREAMGEPGSGQHHHHHHAANSMTAAAIVTVITTVITTRRRYCGMSTCTGTGPACRMSIGMSICP